jgi:hypothetical protein
LQLDGQDVSYEKYNATHARFKPSVPPQTKKIFEYTVTTYHGVREEKLAEGQKKG